VAVKEGGVGCAATTSPGGYPPLRIVRTPPRADDDVAPRGGARPASGDERAGLADAPRPAAAFAAHPGPDGRSPAMQWTELKTNWKDLQGKFKTRWTKLTDADLTAIAGKREELIKKLHNYYKTDEVKLGKEVDEFIKTLKPAHV
jgi:uncharacterized protein YjbJ (UPF0337 family)